MGYIIDIRVAQICMIECESHASWIESSINIAVRRLMWPSSTKLLWVIIQFEEEEESLCVTYSHIVHHNPSVTVLWSGTLNGELISYTCRVGGETGASTQARRIYTAGNKTQDLLAIVLH